MTTSLKTALHDIIKEIKLIIMKCVYSGNNGKKRKERNIGPYEKNTQCYVTSTMSAVVSPVGLKDNWMI